MFRPSNQSLDTCENLLGYGLGVHFAAKLHRVQSDFGKAGINGPCDALPDFVALDHRDLRQL